LIIRDYILIIQLIDTRISIWMF